VDALARVDQIPGWLRPEDADELWELARSADGPILEIGTYRGKSAVLLALALKDANRQSHLYSIDIDRANLSLAADEASARGVAERIVFVHGTVAAFARAYPHVRPAVTFVDGDHSRVGVDRDVAVLERIVPVGGLILFHDFADPRNDDPHDDDVKVRPAVEASWVAQECEFQGTIGVCGLYRRRGGPPALERNIAELMALEPLSTQYWYRLRYPVVRSLRRLARR
jgi:predicted O-methyltransferase YrrM